MYKIAYTGTVLKIALTLLFLLPFSIAAEDVNTGESALKPEGDNKSDREKIEAKRLERITVMGVEEFLPSVPGSAYVLKGEKLEEAKGGFDDIHRALRRIPGVNITEEEGFGLRPNIGLRGAPSERSENITVMEDGILIAPAPYSAPAAYYFPPLGRMYGLEVLKGASQIKYGPRTTGGSLNLLSTPIPNETSLNFNGRAGENDTMIGHFNIGDSFEHFGFLFETYQSNTDGFKRLDGGGDTGHDLQDYLGKIRFNTDTKSEYYQELEIKVGTYDQDSNETYLGLTREDFKVDPYRRYAASQLDNIDVEHEQLHIRHFGQLAENLDITNLLYLNKTNRNWFKLDTVNGKSISNILDEPQDFRSEYDWITGQDSDEGVFKLRNNRRAYASRGIQSIVGYDAEIGETSHEFEVSARFNYDYEDRFQEDDSYTMRAGTLLLDSKGAPGSQANRLSEAYAWAFYLQDKVSVDDWTFTPGVRYERINFKRTDWGRNDPSRSGFEVKENHTDSDKVIPGIGVAYQIIEELSVFGGLHAGFAPPGPQSSNEVKEEESLNYETGVRYKKDAFESEVVMFLNDYDNLLGADTAAAGGSGSGDLFNAGEARVWGSEVALRYDAGQAAELPVALPLYANYTFTSAKFRENFDSSLFGLVRSGDNIPYISKNLISAGMAVDHSLFRVGLDMFYQDSMPTAAGEAGVVSSARTDSHVVFDLEAAWKVKGEEAQIFFMVQNLFDEDYIASIKPAGARPGIPQTFLAGIKLKM